MRKTTIHHVPNHHLTFKDRQEVESIYNKNLRKPNVQRQSLRGIARELGLASSTLQREIRRRAWAG